MTTLNKQERDKLREALSTIQLAVNHLQSFNEVPPARMSVLQLSFAESCKAFAFLFIHTAALLRALESYNELDAELLKAQETIAELEEALEAANRDLESYQVSTFKR